MKCLNELAAGLPPQVLRFLKVNCRLMGFRNECKKCAFYPEESDFYSRVCKLIQDSQKHIKIRLPCRWRTPKDVKPEKYPPLLPKEAEVILKKMRDILDNCPKNGYDRYEYVSEKDCKGCPLLHIACLHARRSKKD